MWLETNIFTYNMEAMERHIIPKNLCMLGAKWKKIGTKSSFKKI